MMKDDFVSEPTGEPTPEELKAAYGQLSPTERRLHLAAVQQAIDNEPKLTPEEDRKLVELTTDVLREGLGQQVDAANDLEIVDPTTGEDPPSTKVALEILAHMATKRLGLWQSPNNFRDAHPLRVGMEQMQLIIGSLANIEPKVLALVAMKSRDQRPCNLSDEAWVYVLTQAQARIARLQESKKGFESLQAYLESRIDADLKAKLRNRVKALVYAENASYDAPPMARAFVLEEPITMTVTAAFWQLNDSDAGKAMDSWRSTAAEGGSFNTQVDEALQRIAVRLQELDTKYGIVGVISHAVLMQCAVQDLSIRYVVGIAPVIKAGPDDIDAMNEGHKVAIRLAPEAGAAERSKLYAGEVVEHKPSMTLETEKEAIESFDAKVQTDEAGEKFIDYGNGYTQKVYPAPVPPQGVEMVPFPTRPQEPVVNQELIVKDRIKKPQPKGGFFKPSPKTSE